MATIIEKVNSIISMGNMKTWWIFGCEWWGDLRPAKMWTKDGRCFVPVVLGLWIRVNG
jgi:hypothetical protein